MVEEVGASALGVALVEEGRRLREGGIQMPILTFAPLHPEGAAAVLKHGLTPVLGRFEDLAALDRVRSTQEISIHLKFNSGMQRLGFDAGDLATLKSELKARPWLTVEGLCTHLTHGEEAATADGPTAFQIRQFRQLSAGFSGLKHVHKSSSLASLEGLVAADDLGSRPGIALYGLPYHNRRLATGVRPALTWISEVTHVHTVEEGQAVSYSGRWTATRRSRIGVVPLGYGDGYMRALSGKGVMLCRGKRVPVVGSVCMDYTLLDLTDLPADQPVIAGEPVVVLGRQGSEEVSAAELAELAGTITYEIATSISNRVPREAV